MLDEPRGRRISSTTDLEIIVLDRIAALEKDYEEVGAETTEGDGEEEDFGEEY